MPHVIVKLWPGKSEQQKTRLAAAITKDVMDVLQDSDEFRFGLVRRNQGSELGQDRLQTRHQGQVGQALQEARL